MALAGIYTYDGDPRETDPEDLIFERLAAWDSQRGVWLESSDGQWADEFDPEDLVDSDVDTVLDLFYERFEGHRGLYIHRESEVPGEIVIRDPLIKPETDLIETPDHAE